MHDNSKEGNLVDQTRKRCKPTLQCTHCDSTFDCSLKLNEHIVLKHTNVQTPCSSPPRKKFEKDSNEPEEEMLDLDDMEINIDKELSMNYLLEKRIRELEMLVATLLEQKQQDDESRSKLEEDVVNLKK